MAKSEESIEDLYNRAKSLHTSFDRRLRMLLRKTFLTEDEELEIREIKKKKLFYKDIMERLSEDVKEKRQ